jgi:pimeloyl-ACP methyl ester carboxylesterase
MQRATSFYSEGSKIAADLYLPDAGGQPKPAVVLAHGFSGVKELLLPAYGKRLSEAGFVTLAFDYRGFGGSEGERGRLVPLEQMADIRNAVTFLQTLPEVNPDAIGLWGSSFGGANSLRVAAVDARVKALVAQLTFGSGARMVTGKMSPDERRKLNEALKKAREREVTKNRPLRLSPGQLITDDDSKAFFAQALRDYPDLADAKIPFTLLQHIIEHNPEDEIHKITCPVLILAADADIVTPPCESQILHDRIRSEKRLVVLPNCRHYEAYAGEPFEKGMAEIVGWFSKFL